MTDNSHLYTQPDEDRPILRHYARLAADQKMWLSSASQLLYVAKLVEPELIEFWKAPVHVDEESRGYSRDDEANVLRLHEIYMMLMGYAIENALKAGIAKRSSKQLFDETLSTNQLPEILNTHELTKLSKKLELALNSSEIALLAKLSANLIWAGRYPVPLKAEAEGSGFPKNEVPTSHTKSFAASDISEINNLLLQIEEHISVKVPQIKKPGVLTSGSPTKNVGASKLTE